MFNAIDLSTTGLIAQRQRMNTIAGNIANVNTTRGADGNPVPFQRRFVTFEADEANRTSSGGAAGVRYQVEIDSKTPPRLVHEPGHPDADAKGFVAYPNINLVTEFVNALGASRAYEANVTAIEMSKEMSNTALRILA